MTKRRFGQQSELEFRAFASSLVIRVSSLIRHSNFVIRILPQSFVIRILRDHFASSSCLSESLLSPKACSALVAFRADHCALDLSSAAVAASSSAAVADVR
jgi:hypothetical protein